jgi:hypothetical protein
MKSILEQFVELSSRAKSVEVAGLAIACLNLSVGLALVCISLLLGATVSVLAWLWPISKGGEMAPKGSLANRA